MISALPVSGAWGPNTMGAQLDRPRISFISESFSWPYPLPPSSGPRWAAQSSRSRTCCLSGSIALRRFSSRGVNSSPPHSRSSGSTSSFTNSATQSSCSWNSGSVSKSQLMTLSSHGGAGAVRGRWRWPSPSSPRFPDELRSTGREQRSRSSAQSSRQGKWRSEMRAAQCLAIGSLDEVVVGEIPDPVPAPGEALVRVRAASVNFPDSLLIAGRYQVQAEPPFIPGSEYAGEIVALGAPGSAGAPADGLQVGDLVCGSVMFGAFAELIAMPLERLTKVPPGVAPEMAASAQVTYTTAFHALHTLG